MTTRHLMIQQGGRAVSAGAPDYRADTGDHCEAQTALGDALASIHHWADWNGLNWHEGLSTAAYHYDAEKSQGLHEESTA